MNGLDAYLTQEPEFCDLEEYNPEYCDECDELQECEIAQNGKVPAFCDACDCKKGGE